MSGSLAKATMHQAVFTVNSISQPLEIHFTLHKFVTQPHTRRNNEALIALTVVSTQRDASKIAITIRLEG